MGCIEHGGRVFGIWRANAFLSSRPRPSARPCQPSNFYPVLRTLFVTFHSRSLWSRGIVSRQVEVCLRLASIKSSLSPSSFHSCYTNLGTFTSFPQNCLLLLRPFFFFLRHSYITCPSFLPLVFLPIVLLRLNFCVSLLIRLGPPLKVPAHTPLELDTPSDPQDFLTRHIDYRDPIPGVEIAFLYTSLHDDYDFLLISSCANHQSTFFEIVPRPVAKRTTHHSSSPLTASLPVSVI